MTVNDFNACVDTYADSVFRFILKNLKDKEKARDIVQETFEKMWVRVADIQVEKAKSYLFTTAYHTMIDWLRKEKRMVDFDLANENEYSTDNHYSDVKQVLHDALSKLNPVQRSVLLLRDYEGYNYQEIGTITGLSESQVKVYIYRARVFLKNYLGSIHQVI